MRKMWLIATTTYRRQVRSGMFLVLTLGLPLLMLIAGAIPFFLARSPTTLSPTLGYIDLTGRFASLAQPSRGSEHLRLLPYASQAAAQAALQQGRISGYLLIPPDYFRGGIITLYAKETSGDNLAAALAARLREAQLPQAPPWLLERLANPSDTTYVAQNSGMEAVGGPAMILRVAFPAILALIFALVVFTGAGQMGSAIIHEKEQRALEIVVTSLRPYELVIGKILGMTLLSLTQVAIWLAAGSLAFGLALASSGRPLSLSIPWAALVWAILLGLPGYFLYATLGAGLGLIAGDSRQAQQLAGLLGLAGLAPLWLASLLLTAPDGPAAVAMTLFPLTAPSVGLLRMSLAEVPVWQLLVGLAILLLSLGASTWFVTRLFRAAMLMYGQALRPQQILQVLRQG